jgi:K+-transporting ATPase A subunit
MPQRIWIDRFIAFYGTVILVASLPYIPALALGPGVAQLATMGGR